MSVLARLTCELKFIANYGRLELIADNQYLTAFNIRPLHPYENLVVWLKLELVIMLGKLVVVAYCFQKDTNATEISHSKGRRRAKKTRSKNLENTRVSKHINISRKTCSGEN